ncbi:MAG: hypothetical protein RIM33_02755 [Alphaproteobacteria bacterium]
MTDLSIFSTNPNQPFNANRAIARALMMPALSGQPTGIGGAAANIGASFLARSLMDRADRQETESRDRQNSAMTDFLTGRGVDLEGVSIGDLPSGAHNALLIQALQGQPDWEYSDPYQTQGGQWVRDRSRGESFEQIAMPDGYVGPLDDTESFETVQSPFGLGGVGQRNSRTGQIVNYQEPRTQDSWQYSDPYQTPNGDWVRDRTRGDQFEVVPMPAEYSGQPVTPDLSEEWTEAGELTPRGFEERIAPLSEKVREAQRAFNQVNAAIELANAGNAQASLSAMVTFQKLIDEGAVVREGDIALTREAQSISGRIQAMIESASTGQVIPAEALRQIGEASRAFVAQAVQSNRAELDSLYQRSREIYPEQTENYILPQARYNQLFADWGGPQSGRQPAPGMQSIGELPQVSAHDVQGVPNVNSVEEAEAQLGPGEPFRVGGQLHQMNGDSPAPRDSYTYQGRSYTLQQVQQVAREEGISVDELIRRMEAAGVSDGPGVMPPGTLSN